MQTTTREIYTFFLAEMSLRAIWSRVSNAPANELLKAVEKSFDYCLSPMGNELEGQLKRWYQEIPGFLSWSIEPGEGRISKIGARLKLLYWFTVFSIYRPLLEYVASKAKVCLSLNSWVLLQAALQAGLNLARVVVTENSERDPILYTWYVSNMYFVKHPLIREQAVFCSHNHREVICHEFIDWTRKNASTCKSKAHETTMKYYQGPSKGHTVNLSDER